MPPLIFAAAMRRILETPPAPSLLAAALSGGVDSVVLLHLLAAWHKTLPSGNKPRLLALHLNHHLRGDASDGDQAFCRDYAAALNVPFVTRDENVASFAQAQRLGLEEAGRLLRQRFFQELAGPGGLVLTGHHAGDQVETILMRLHRGAHRRGLAGMREYTRLEPMPGRTLCLARPLLELERAAILAYARENGLSWREDASNASPVFFRNRLRQHLVPLLENWLPGFGRRLRARAKEWAVREDELVQAGDRLLAAGGRRENGGCFFATQQELSTTREEANTATPEVLRYALRRLYEQETAQPLQDGATLARLYALSQNGRLGETLTLPGGIRVRKEYDGLFFFPAGAGEVTAPEMPLADTLILPEPPFCLRRDGLTITAEIRYGAPPAEDCGNPEVEWLNLDAVRFPWRLRPPRLGERMRPLGAQGSRKLQDIMVDAKIPRRERGVARVLADSEGCLWLWPLRLAERARVKEGREKAVRVEIRGASLTPYTK